MVEEDVVEATTVVRLDNPETKWRSVDPAPVRLGSHTDEAHDSQRLDLPDKEEIQLRTHQPGIDALIEQEVTSKDILEQVWGGSTSHGNPIPWGWFALIGLIVAGTVTWSLTQRESPEGKAGQLLVEAKTAVVDDKNDELEAILLVERIENTIRTFFKSTSVESLAKMARHAERVEPLMKAYYGEKPVQMESLAGIKILQPLTLNNRGNFWIASVVLSGSGVQSLIVEIMESGEPRIDWETLVCHQPMKWDDFVAQRPEGKEMDFRVYAERDSFYSHEFADTEQWLSLRLTTIGADETLFGYVRRGGPEALELMRLFKENGRNSIPLILRLSIPEGIKSRRGVVVEKIVSSRWIYIDPPNSSS